MTRATAVLTQLGCWNWELAPGSHVSRLTSCCAGCRTARAVCVCRCVSGTGTVSCVLGTGTTDAWHTAIVSQIEIIQIAHLASDRHVVCDCLVRDTRPEQPGAVLRSSFRRRQPVLPGSPGRRRGRGIWSSISGRLGLANTPGTGSCAFTESAAFRRRASCSRANRCGGDSMLTLVLMSAVLCFARRWASPWSLQAGRGPGRGACMQPISSPA